MKKYLVILLSLVFVLSTVGFVFADDAGMDSVRAMKPGAKVQIGGDARVRGIWFKNPSFDSDADDDNRFYDQRIRLKFRGEAGNGVSANLRLYISNSPKWDGTNNTNCEGCILVDYAYITIPVSTATVDAGLMKENFGNTLYLYDDRYDILKVSGQFESVKVSVFTRKIVDTFDTVIGDENLKDFNDYGATLVANVNDIEAGAIIVYHHDNRQTVPGTDNDTGTDISLYANAAMNGINVGGELTFLTGDINKTPDDNTPLGLMLFAKTTVGAIGVRADFAFASNLFTANNNYVPSLLIGTDQNTAILNFASIADDEKAWLAAGTVDTDVMENVNVKGRVAYWSAKDGAGDTNSLLELDGIVSYQIAKNARYIVEAAYGNPSDEIGEDAIIVLANKAELYF
jgi:hypothetical protein